MKNIKHCDKHERYNPICCACSEANGHCLGQKQKPDPSALNNLLADIASNKEMFFVAHKTPQIDAEERRKEMTVVGPARLIDALMDALTGG